ncbi:MAG TPA: Asp-tRNA(Asn)/Glu-tRNA(Gln) amidotransferase subunit GatB [Candidatus Dormibacteraeota bacterium]
MSAALESQWEPVIGLEVHAQLLTRSKMFCSCRADYLGLAPNSNTCPVCLGLPGTLPVINAEGIRLTLRTALALNCEIPEFTKFDRKNYFYPDLPKGYQISQYDLPLSRNGWLEFQVDGRLVRGGITRVHLEEDTGTLHHSGEIHNSSFSLVDLNRAGVPLMEIVGEPDLASPAEARAYLANLRQLLVYIGVNDGNMEEGSVRCDANISLRVRGTTELGVKVEVKNMNSFRSVLRALEYELVRQRQVLDDGGRVLQETRGWSELEQRTVSQRSKEEAQEYRYFPEPDLPPLLISRAQVEEVRAGLPELPSARRARFQTQYGLTEEQAVLLTARPADSGYFEAAVGFGVAPQLAANWQLGDLQGLCNAASIGVEEAKVSPRALAELLQMVERQETTARVAKEVLARAFVSGESPAELIRSEGRSQVSDPAEIAAMVDQVLAENAQAARDYQAGNDRALGRLVGGVMAASKGRANAALVNQLLQERLPRARES